MIFRRTTGLRDLVAARGVEGNPVIHLPSSWAEYDTLCGLDTTEPENERLTLPRGARVNCPQCVNTWYAAKAIPASFISPDAINTEVKINYE